jgi:hypothetical protein
MLNIGLPFPTPALLRPLLLLPLPATDTSVAAANPTVRALPELKLLPPVEAPKPVVGDAIELRSRTVWAGGGGCVSMDSGGGGRSPAPALSCTDSVRCVCNSRMLLLLIQSLGMLLLLLPGPLVAQAYMNVDTVHVMTNLLTRSLTGASTYTCTSCLSVTSTHLPERTPSPQTCVGSAAASAPSPRQSSPPCDDCWASWASPAAVLCPNPVPGSCVGRALQ